jgi:hypothetical protein
MGSPTFQNLGFEVAGGAPGTALGWTVAFQASAEEIAGYGSGPELPAEDFERLWAQNESFLFSLSQTAVEPALYDTAQAPQSPKSLEDFERDWSQNEAFLTEMGSSEAALYAEGAVTRPAETFEGSWANNDAFLSAFGEGDLWAAPIEGFESGWRGNESYLFDFSASGTIALGPLDTFEAGWTTTMRTV